MPSFDVRPVRTDEREAFLGPALRSWLDAYDGLLDPAEVAEAPAMLARAWDKRAGAFRVAVRDDRILGFYSLGDADDPERRDYLWHLYVDPEVQRQGVGRALHDTALAELADRGVRRAWLDVMRHNLKARAFYRELGWRELPGDDPRADAEPRYDEILMERDLQRMST